MIDIQKIIDVCAYFSVISHTKGRIRVRVNPEITKINEGKDVTLKDIEEISQKVQGIKNIKINKIVGSITIEYDNSIFPDKLWSDLIAQKNLTEISAIINKLWLELK